MADHFSGPRALAGHAHAEMKIGGARRHAAARGAHEEALLDQEWLDDILESAALLAHRGGQALDAHRPAVEFLDDGRQQLTVERVESLRIHFEQIERGARHRFIDAAVAFDFGVVAHATKQPVGDTRRAARAGRNTCRAFGVDRHAEDSGRTRHDLLELRHGVELEALHDAEAIAQR